MKMYLVRFSQPRTDIPGGGWTSQGSTGAPNAEMGVPVITSWFTLFLIRVYKAVALCKGLTSSSEVKG